MRDKTAQLISRSTTRHWKLKQAKCFLFLVQQFYLLTYATFIEMRCKWCYKRNTAQDMTHKRSHNATGNIKLLLLLVLGFCLVWSGLWTPFWCCWLGDRKGIRPLKTLHQNPLDMVVGINGWDRGGSNKWHGLFSSCCFANVNFVTIIITKIPDRWGPTHFADFPRAGFPESLQNQELQSSPL